MSSDRRRQRRVLRAAPEAGVARPRAGASIAVLAGCGVLSTLVSLGAQAQLPVPCGGGACSNAAFANTVSGRATAAYSAAGNRATVQQSAPKAILNWQSFNVGAGNSVEFRQPDASSVALNRIHQGSPSQIRGQLSANGQVYLINQNGIVFGAGAQVNVHSLVASSLTVSDPDFINGILGPINELGGGRAVFVPFRDAGGTIQPSGAVRVEAGAVLESKAGGRVMVLAPVVENRGEIRTPDGQAILGAGNHVYLQASQDSNLRGLLIEVDTQGDAPGTVNNLGRIVAERGNATLIGLAVNQMGRVSATTSVNVNGSVRLLARSGAEQNPNLAQSPQVRIASTTGALTLGPGSVTEVQPEAPGGDTTVRSSVFNLDGSLRSPSRIELMGDRIALQAGASVVAPAGDIRATALKDPRQYNEATNTLVGTTRTDSRIHLEAGSRIDAAGTNALLPMERNQLEVELRGSELRDKPLQRDGILRGKTITIDVRKGTQLADVQGAIDNAPIGVEEKTVSGGRVALKSDGDIVTSAGSSIDASGGSVRFADGYVKTTKLISGNRIYDVSVASPDRVYDSFADSYEVKHPKWGERATQRWTAASGAASGAQFHSGYVEGRAAGTIELRGYGLVLGGDLRAARTPGEFQRDPATLPQPGRLVIGAAEQLDAASGVPNFATPDVRLVAQARARSVAQGDASVAGETVDLPIALLRDGGFGRVEIYGNGTIRQEHDAPIDVPPGGAVVMIAREIDVRGSITARSGSISLATRSVADEPPGAAHRLAIDAATVLDARGLWVNDGPAASSAGQRLPMLLDGGAVSIASVGELVLPRGSLIDVGGGGAVSSKGELLRNKDTGLPRGDAGAISLSLPSGTDLGTDLRAAALGKGGTLALGADDIVIGAGTGSSPGTHVVAPDFLQTGGFATATLNAQHSLKVEPGVRVDLRTTNLVPGTHAAAQPSGADVRSFAPLGALDDSRRLPATLNLAVVGPYGDGSGVLEIGAGARLSARSPEEPGRPGVPKAEVRLASSTRIAVAGAIDVPAGRITLEIPTPPQATDPGFQPTQAIVLADGAVLAATGVLQEKANARGLLSGSVLAGGAVAINANRGYIVAAPGSMIDVSGAASPIDIPVSGGYERRTVGSAGGSIGLFAAEGMLLDGTLAGRAGTDQAQGATLNVATATPTGGGSTRIEVARGGPAGPSAGVLAGDPVPARYAGRAVLAEDTVRSGGFDVVGLSSRSAVELAAGSRLASGRAITIETPVVSVTGTGVATLASANVTLGNGVASLQTPPAAVGGDGVLRLEGAAVDLVGGSTVHGASRVEIASTGDLRLRGVLDNQANANRLRGAFSVAGTLDISARQVYPTTLSEFTLRASDDVAHATPGRIDLRAGGEPTPVLSAGGDLTLQASLIRQAGVLKAPFGMLRLQAGQDLTLAAGSLTSVSGEGQSVPFGLVQNGRDWFYDVSGVLRSVTEAPDKAVILNAPAVTVAGASGATPAARIDVRGGGSLTAYEFVPGTGGSGDVLANQTLGSGTARPTTITVGGKTIRFFAVLPGLASVSDTDLAAMGLQPADGARILPRVASVPYDAQLYAGSDLRPGDAVYLSGAAGLPAGTYALLPARYALQKGAYLVGAVDGFQDIQPGQPARITGGTAVSAGYRTVLGGTLQDSRWSGYAVLPRNGAAGTLAVNTLADYLTAEGGSFLPARAAALDQPAPRVPVDAGRLVLSDMNALDLSGDVFTAAATGGRGARVDIAASRLSVVPAGAVADGTVQVDAARLSSFGAQSLLLGGTRAESATGTALSVVADQVAVKSGAAIFAPEVVLAARESVVVEEHATVAAGGTASAPAVTLTLGRGVDADGAMLRVSNGGQATVLRDTPAGARGTLDVRAGATVSGNALALDSTLASTLGGTLSAGGGSVAFGANRISAGDGAGTAGSLNLSNARLASDLAGVDEMILRAAQSIDLHGNVKLGDAPSATGYRLRNLELHAGAVRGYGQAGETARLFAADVVLSNPGSTSPQPGSGGGAFAIDAGRVTLGAGDKRLSGYSAVSVRADESVTITGAGSLAVPTLRIETGVVTATRLADQVITAAGSVVIAGNGNAALERPAGLAGRLAIAGTTIDVSGRMDLPAGSIRLTASGADVQGNGITAGDGAVVTTRGVATPVFDAPVFAPGGNVTLTASAGGIRVAPAAAIDVSASGQGGDAGFLAIHAAGRADLAGTFGGSAGAGQRGGSFALTASALDDVSALLPRIAGFTEEAALRARSGSVELRAGDHIAARHVAITADAGSITLAGSSQTGGAVIPGAAIEAPGGGRVDLHAQGDIELRSGAAISAREDATGAGGGRVTLGTTQGRLRLAEGARIDVTGTKGGEVVLRAPRTGAGPGNGIAIDGGVDGTGAVVSRIGTDIGVGASDVIAEGVKAYGTTSITATSISEAASPASNWFNEAKTFMGNLPSIEAGLGRAGDPTFQVVPGIEVQSTTDLALNTDWSLHRWRYNSETGAVVTAATDLSRGFVQTTSGGTTRNVPLSAGVLTLRSAGDLNLNFSLSDGYAGATATSTFNDGGASWSYRLSAGGDLASADPLALMPLAQLAPGKGSVIVAAGTPPAPTQANGTGNAPSVVKQVRTGDGDIEIAAGRDLVLKSQQSMIYTAGRMIQRRTQTPSAPNSTAVHAGGGGDISLYAQGNISSEKLANDLSNQLVTGWLHREGGGATPASWWIDSRYFQQNVATLGGGDVTVRSGGNIENLAVSIPTNKRAADAAVNGGGDLVVRATGDIRSGLFYVADGKGTIEAGGEFGFKREIALTQQIRVPVYPILALGDATIDVRAGRSLTLETALNPTVILQSVEQGAAARSYFYGYGEGAGVSLTSLAGNVTLSNNAVAMESAIATGRGRTGQSSTFGSDRQALFVYPPNLTAAAPLGDVIVANPYTLFPAPRGQLELLAGGSVKAGDVAVNLSDTDPAGLPRVGNPSSSYSTQLAERLTPTALPSVTHAAVPVRADPAAPDAQPVRIYAARGDIDGGRYYLAKQAILQAGRDVKDMSLFGQNVSSADVTFVTAGRDVIFNTPRDARNAPQSNPDTLELAGPGRLEIRAGRNVDLGSSAGIVTTGNLKNPALTAFGADVMVSAGVPDAPAYDRIVGRYLAQYEQAYALATLESMSVEQREEVTRRLGLDQLSTERKAALVELRDELTRSIAVRRQDADPGLQALVDTAERLRKAMDTGDAGSLATLLVRASGLLGTTPASAAEAIPALRALAWRQVGADVIARPYDFRNEIFFGEIVAAARQASQVLSDRSRVQAEGQDPVAKYQEALDRGREALRVLFPATSHASDLLGVFDSVGLANVQARAEKVYPGLRFADPVPVGTVPRPEFDPATDLARTMWRTRAAAGGTVDGKWVANLFPEVGRAGDVSLFFSQIRTLSGGDIDILAPWGGVNAGVAAAPGGFSKAANELGIVAQDAGRVRIAACCDLAVNQSRVFTLRGGDLVIWTPDGRVDAGKGSKTALSAPPPTLVVDSSGNVSVRVSGAASGSGIRVLATRPGDLAGALNITADEIDAGDAGIGSAGSASFVAPVVKGGENISVAGASNIPPPDTSGLAGGLTSVGNTAAESNRGSEQATRAVAGAQAAQTLQQSYKTFFITVEVLGFGD